MNHDERMLYDDFRAEGMNAIEARRLAKRKTKENAPLVAEIRAALRAELDRRHRRARLGRMHANARQGRI